MTTDVPDAVTFLMEESRRQADALLAHLASLEPAMSDALAELAAESARQAEALFAAESARQAATDGGGSAHHAHHAHQFPESPLRAPCG
jgi:hypothetical protein